ncbi:jg25292, partial [Pararge aegeria aegeria]
SSVEGRGLSSGGSDILIPAQQFGNLSFLYFVWWNSSKLKSQSHRFSLDVGKVLERRRTGNAALVGPQRGGHTTSNESLGAAGNKRPRIMDFGAHYNRSVSSC